MNKDPVVGGLTYVYQRSGSTGGTFKEVSLLGNSLTKNKLSMYVRMRMSLRNMLMKTERLFQTML
jgi:hypothetical protein